MRILLVEQNSRAAAFTADLKREAINAEAAPSAQDALDLLRVYAFDLVLLNLTLADMDGVALIRQIRASKCDTPIIAVSNVPQARLKALSLGADDAVERDVDPIELAARIRAVIRRSRGFTQSKIEIGGLTLDVDQRTICANDLQVRLTGKEFEILQLLMLRRNMIMTKEAILTHIYGGLDEPEIKIIDVFVCKLRSKLKKAGLPEIISTVWGRGYTVTDNDRGGPVVTPRPRHLETQLAFA